MYAVVRTGGKQYRVAEGETVRVEKLAGVKGDTITLDQVLLVGDGEGAKVGRPLVAGARVAAEIVRQGRGKKVVILKYRRRKRYRLKKGHRQSFTQLKITRIEA